MYVYSFYKLSPNDDFIKCFGYNITEYSLFDYAMSNYKDLFKLIYTNNNELFTKHCVPEKSKMIVEEINEITVELESWLSDNVYGYYRAEDSVFMFCSDEFD